MTLRVAIVGAGVAGAGVATAVAESDLETRVTVLERSGVGGRTATRRRSNCVYDTGANYVTDGSERVSTLVRSIGERGSEFESESESEPTDNTDTDIGPKTDLVDIEAPVWTFDADGTIAPGDDDRSDDHKWTFEDGLETLPRRLLERSGATALTGVDVTAFEQSSTDDGSRDRWHVDTDDDRFGPFDAVVLTPPGPETAAILDASERSSESSSPTDLESVANTARSVSYRSIHSFALHYPFALERPFYALVNTDRDHPVGWVAREDEKRGHVPDGESLLIAQMAPDWSVENRSRSADEAAREVAGHVASLLSQTRLSDPDWADRIVWRDALPNDAIETNTASIQRSESAGLFLASDCTHGEGRIHAALESGLAVGDRILEAFETV